MRNLEAKPPAGSLMSESFHVGERVVCIDDSDLDDTGTSVGVRYLRRGKTYTVLRTYVLPSGPGINLEEIDAPYSYEGFRAERFRSAMEHQEDVSIFARALEAESQTLETA
jgi:hypothetical protein